MEKSVETATNIFNKAKEIYDQVEQTSPELLLEVQQDDDKSIKNAYYFKNDMIRGAIIKEHSKWPNYTVQSTIKYINSTGDICAFAKVRIFKQFGEIELKGNRNGSFLSPDFMDIDFLYNPDRDMLAILKSYESSIYDIYNSITKDNVQAIKTYNLR